MTDKIIIYAPSGDSYISVPVTRDATISCSLMGDCYTLLSFRHNQLLPISRGFAIYHSVRKWEIMDEVFPQRDANGGYKYELKFYAQQHHMKRCRVFWTQNNIREATFNLTTTLSTYAKLICDNMNAFLSNGEAKNIMHWSVGSIPEELNEKSLNYAFNGVTCWNAVDDIAKLFEVEWWVEDDSKKNSATLYFGKCELNEVEDFEEGKIVKELPTPRRGDSSEYGTRFYVFGGTRNLPEDYNANKQGGETNHVSEKRLHLPDGVPYIDAYNGLKGCDVVEQVVFLDDIYPKNTETVTDVFTRKVTADGKIYTYWNIVCENTAFVPSNMIENAPLSAVFTSGSLNGREFELYIEKKNDLTFDKTFEINDKTDGSGDTAVTIPNEYLKPEIGDTFVLTGVKLPERYVREAENTLLEMAAEVVKERSGDTTIYECSTNVIYCTKNDKSFELGQRVRLKGGAFGDTGRLSRIQKLERKLYNKYDAVYSVGDNTPYSKYSFLQGKIVSVIDSEAKLEDSQSTLDGRNKREKIKISELTDNKADKGELEGLASEVYVDTQIKPIADDRLQFKREKDSILAEYDAINRDFRNFIAKYEELYDADGKRLYDADGKALFSLIPTEVFSKFKAAYDDYEQQIHIVTLSTGVPAITEQYLLAQKNYYEAKAQLQQAVSDKTLKDIDDISYLTDVFGEDNIANEKAVTLSSLVGVKDADSNVVAGIYGGGVEELNNNKGFKDNEHGALMVFAGAEGVGNASNAKFRVYDDGTLFAETGIFGGFVKRSRTRITNNNKDKYINGGNELGSGFPNIDIEAAGSYIELALTTSASNNQIDIELPYWKANAGDTWKYPLADMLAIIGTTLIIRNVGTMLRSPIYRIATGMVNRYYTTTSTGEVVENETFAEQSAPEFRLNQTAIATCKAVATENGLNVGWEIKII